MSSVTRQADFTPYECGLIVKKGHHTSVDFADDELDLTDHTDLEAIFYSAGANPVVLVSSIVSVTTYEVVFDAAAWTSIGVAGSGEYEVTVLDPSGRLRFLVTGGVTIKGSRR